MALPPDAATGAAVCAALRAQVARLGLALGGDEPQWADAVLEERIDPYSQEFSVVAVWSGRERYGSASFFPDGRIFAEYQVLLPHPQRPGSYVDCVQVWGQPPKWRGDAVIAAYPA